jgi:hypothetical protein
VTPKKGNFLFLRINTNSNRTEGDRKNVRGLSGAEGQVFHVSVSNTSPSRHAVLWLKVNYAADVKIFLILLALK